MFIELNDNSDTVIDLLDVMFFHKSNWNEYKICFYLRYGVECTVGYSDSNKRDEDYIRIIELIR